MGGHDAYEDEMGLVRAHDIDDPEFSSMVDEIRFALRRAPKAAVEARHISAMVEQARHSPVTPMADLPGGRRRSSRPVRVLAKLGAAAAGLGLIAGGLALAGVDLPVLPDPTSDKAREQIDRSSAVDTADGRSEIAVRVQATIAAHLPSVRAGEMSGCEFGAMVSAAARGITPDSSHCRATTAESGEGGSSEIAQRVQAAIAANLRLLRAGDISGCEFGAMVSAAARGTTADPWHCKSKTAEGESDESTDSGGGTTTGQGKAKEASAGKANGRGTSKEATTTGQDKAEEVSGGKANAKGNGAQRSAKGKAKTKEAKAAGQGTAEEVSGGKANPGGKSDED
jgi:hypothetical protein